MAELSKKEIMQMLIGIKFAGGNFSKVIKTTSGRVRGVSEKSHQVLQWFGIPYAQRAIGDLRWHKPVPVVPDTKILDCSRPAEQNLQHFAGKTFGIEGSLTLDICRQDSNATNLPVMVFFHGGNYQFGNSREWMGNRFCQERNAVFVSVEYRMGAFGFVNLPALKTGDPLEDSGNFMLLDCLAALKWVQDNIERFGGNPNNVTISGFSAGGIVCLAMLISPLFKGLFHKTIVFSAAPVVSDFDKAELVYAHYFATLAVEDGLVPNEEEGVAWLTSRDEADMAAVRKWLQGLDAGRVTRMIPLASVRLNYLPFLMNDGVVLPKEGFATENFNSVPLLCIATKGEFRTFVTVDPYFKKRLKLNPFNPQTQAEVAFASKYGSELFRHRNSHFVGETFYGRYTAPIYMANVLFGTTTSSVDKKFKDKFSAAHGIEIPFLTDQSKIAWVKGNDFFQQMGAECLSISIMGIIKSFMEKGNPNCAEIKLDWKEWSPECRYEACLDADRDRALVTDNYDNFTYDKLFDEMDEDNSIVDSAKSNIIHKVLNGRWFCLELDERYGNESLWYEK